VLEGLGRFRTTEPTKLCTTECVWDKSGPTSCSFVGEVDLDRRTWQVLIQLVDRTGQVCAFPSV
jgi:hypothetical protein